MMTRHYPDSPFVAVGTIVVRDGRVLLAQRGKEPSYGLWSLPGGAVDLGEGLKAAARRETREECGIEVDITDVLEVVERMVRVPDGRVRFHYVIVDYLARWVSGGDYSASRIRQGLKNDVYRRGGCFLFHKFPKNSKKKGRIRTPQTRPFFVVSAPGLMRIAWSA